MLPSILESNKEERDTGEPTKESQFITEDLKDDKVTIEEENHDMLIDQTSHQLMQF